MATRIEVITSTERRRSYTDADRAAILAKCAEPGAFIAAVARRCETVESLIYDRRSKQRADVALASEPLQFTPCREVAEVHCGRGAGHGAAAFRFSRPAHGRVASGARCRTRRDRRQAAHRRAAYGGRRRQREGAGAGAARPRQGSLIQLAPGAKMYLACKPVLHALRLRQLLRARPLGARRQPVLREALYLPKTLG